ncbi:MAG: hypothetical protein ACXVLM_11150 [Ilumatobacteraceae bacterium]
MTQTALASVMLKSIAGAMVVALGVVGAHGSVSKAVGDIHAVQQSVGQHGVSEHDDGHSRNCRRSNDDVGHDSHDRTGSRRPPAAGLQQVIEVGVPRTVFVRVDKSGHITAAATNTGCPPRTGDDFFVFRPSGKVEPTATINAAACNWSGAFAVAARFYPQHCTTNHSRHPEGSH